VLAPGGVARRLCDALEAAGPYGAGWPSPRVAAGPVAAAQGGIVGNGHVRGSSSRRRRQELQVDRLPQRRRVRSARPCSPRRRPDKRWWLAGRSSATSGTAGNAAEMHLEDAALA
jgi:single-stranded-DNA-specific exonuclease